MVKPVDDPQLPWIALGCCWIALACCSIALAYSLAVPELPEVETIRRQLAPRLVGREIVDAGSHLSAKFTPALETIGGEVLELHRRGKYLIAVLFAPTQGQRELIIHLGMTGRLALDHLAVEHQQVGLVGSDDHLRAWWRLDDGRTLRFHDVRRFGRIRCVDAGDYSGIPTLRDLGPEPFDVSFDGARLAAFVRSSNRHLKTILLSQRAVAGVGNIYADEALWMAAINPATRRLSVERADRLVVSIRETLQSGLDHGGTTLRDYVDADGMTGANQQKLLCYGRSREPCLRCGSELRRRIIDARSTTWCPKCQAR